MVDILLPDLALPQVQEAYQGGKLTRAHLQVDQGVGVRAPQHEIMEKMAARTEDDLVNFDMVVVFTDKGDITKVIVLVEMTEGFSSMIFEIISK